MRRCLELADAAPGRIAPNPRVGCVIVDARGRLLAEGLHRGPGTAHAEVDALRALGGEARGATLYVNLEPCAHHGRTPPCAPVVAASGVARVVIGVLDPVPGHGGGARLLRRAGVAVKTGVLAAEVRRHNRIFFTWAEQGRPYVVLKAAMTLDGKIATASGQSRWISGEPARALAHTWRAQLEAIAVGRGTVLADDPRLTVRLPPERDGAAGPARGTTDPVRVILDSHGTSPPGAKVFDTPGALVACRRDVAPRRVAALRARGAEPIFLPLQGGRAGGAGRVSVKALLRALAKRGLTSLLVEGGAELHAAFLAAGVVDELRLFVAPLVLGGQGTSAGPSWVGGIGVSALARAPRFVLSAPPQQVGDDVLLVLRPAAAIW
ncbi:MAG: bifunctional diaminohydroxyphosphoribosylaminopyrimidine deaminase/5-amino-6-(5-phosphoribosylamino)uracil reductase RibD [Myxococcales bacterium]|nr:bifunctional diaminohydroxyphosphoribosylaminopyrimidine deaminase/5-amino-6-(5-phosphoribosylamino)uracil reductase RibD [Myxococcales bacterium]